jgi:D-sedoheptulose 7-phosphate isomerase
MTKTAQATPQQVAREYIAALGNAFSLLNISEISNLISLLEKKLRQGETIFLAGNGGSAATASHAVCDLNKTVLGPQPSTSSSVRFRAMSLSDNIPSITAIANDLSYDYIFSEQLKNYSHPGDLLIVITGSGNSTNIIRALETAKDLKLETAGLLGFDGGLALSMLDYPVLVPSKDYGVIEDTHSMIFHLITRYFRTIISTMVHKLIFSESRPTIDKALF